MGSEEEQFAGIVGSFLSIDNDLRSQAEVSQESTIYNYLILS
jgi:hypothetical protein